MLQSMRRCNFYLAKQAKTESVAEFVARLKNLSLNYNFSDVNTALRSQLVCGLKDHTTKTELFREKKLTYDTAYKIAVALEKAEENASKTDKLNSSATTREEVHTIITANRKQYPH